MTVGTDTPERLWVAPQRLGTSEWRRLRRATRVPTFRPRGVIRKLKKDLLIFAGDAIDDVECLVLDDEFSPWINDFLPSGDEKRYGYARALRAVAWPPRLKSLYFGSYFSSPLDHTAFPAGLEELTFGVLFRQTVDQVKWPRSLARLTSGKYFDSPIHNVRWPRPSLQCTFGSNFKQLLNHISWPPSLRQLRLGHRFEQKASVVAVKWPPSLKSVEIDHHVEGFPDEVIHRPTAYLVGRGSSCWQFGGMGSSSWMLLFAF